MKKILLLILLTVVFNGVKAQQGKPIKPGMMLPDSLSLTNSFRSNLYPSPMSLLLQPVQTGSPISLIDKNTRIVYSRMPVVGMSSGDRMPVAGIGQSNNQDHMPVLKITVIDPLRKAQQQLP